MKNKPLIFNFYAIFFIIIAVAMPLQIMSIYGHSLAETTSILSKMSFFNILVIGVSLFNFYYCYTASDKVKWSFPLSIGLVCFNNSFVMIYGNDFEILTVILSTVMFMAICAFFLVSQDTGIMNAPDKQWWRIPDRLSIHERIKLTVNQKEIDMGQSFDLSIGGAFIPFTSKTDWNNYTNGDIISCTIGEVDPIKCEAKVVRKTLAKGIYPEGMGLQFINIGLTGRAKLHGKIFMTKLYSKI